MAKTLRINGTTMLDGYIAERGPRSIIIEIIGGKAFDRSALELLGDHAEPLRLTDDGALSDSARGGFLPNDGELSRVEAVAGHKIFG